MCFSRRKLLFLSMHAVYLLFKLYVRIIESDMHIIYRLRALTVQLRVDRHIETCKEKLKL